jgi:hypothetical protein
MRVILHGPVTADHLADAELMAGITPTSFVTNGLSHPPRGSRLPVEVMPICMKQPAETRIRAREYSMVQAADALICADYNPGLVLLARNYDLLVYEVSE